MQVGGRIYSIPRCGHSAFVNNSELIIMGGQGKKFDYRKELMYINLNQDTVDRTNPLLHKMKIHLHQKVADFKRAQSIFYV